MIKRFHFVRGSCVPGLRHSERQQPQRKHDNTDDLSLHKCSLDLNRLCRQHSTPSSLTLLSGGTYDSSNFQGALMRAILMLLLTVALLPAMLSAQNRPAKTLDIYVIDVEGGNSQLYVSPSGESVLIDTGNAGAA